jgi:hypothetical protein
VRTRSTHASIAMPLIKCEGKAELDADLKAIDCPEIFINKIFANDFHFYFVMGEKLTLYPSQKMCWPRLAAGAEQEFDEAHCSASKQVRLSAAAGRMTFFQLCAASPASCVWSVEIIKIRTLHYLEISISILNLNR